MTLTEILVVEIDDHLRDNNTKPKLLPSNEKQNKANKTLPSQNQKSSKTTTKKEKIFITGVLLQSS